MVFEAPGITPLYALPTVRWNTKTKTDVVFSVFRPGNVQYPPNAKTFREFRTRFSTFNLIACHFPNQFKRFPDDSLNCTMHPA